ncbi:MAG: hypothetical protein KatS3mg123_1159 [Burkholderiales bacterium]|nr:MAG: hypothetical protein KatS3mg123_1159 [Burkholderiales bacterium]
MPEPAKETWPSHAPMPGRPPGAFFTVRSVPPESPFAWVRAGWNDLKRSPSVSLSHGALFAMMGILLHIYFHERPEVARGLAVAFALVTPLLVIGLQEASRRLERSLPVPFAATLTAWRGNPAGVCTFAVLCALGATVWLRLSAGIAALFFSGAEPAPGGLLREGMFSRLTYEFLVVYWGAAALFGGFAFAGSAVALPLLLARRVDAFTAIRASLCACRRNPRAMALLAAMLAALLGAGMLPFYVGLVFAAPLAGHALWHAYRDLVAPG